MSQQELGLAQIQKGTKAALLEIITFNYLKLIRDPVVAVLHGQTASNNPQLVDRQIQDIFRACVQNALALEIDRLSDELALAQIANAGLSKKVQDSQQLKDTSSSTLINQKLISQLQRDKKTLETRLEELLRQKQAKESGLREVLKLYSNSQKASESGVEFTIKRLISELKFCQKSLASREELIEKMNKEASGLQQRIGVLEETLNTKQTQLAEARVRAQSGLDELENSRQAKELRGLQYENIKLKVDIREAKNIIKDQEQRLETVLGKLTVFQKQQVKNKVGEQQRLDLTRENKSLRAQLSDIELKMRQSAESYSVECTELSNKMELLYKACQREIALKNARITDLETQALRYAQRDQQDYQQKLSGRSGVESSASVSLRQPGQSQHFASRIEELCKAKISEFEKQLNFKSTRIAELQNQLSSTAKQRESLEKVIENLKNDNRDSEDRAQSAISERDILNKTLEFCKRVYDQERVQLKKMVNHHQEAVAIPNRNFKKDFKTKVIKTLMACLSQTGKMRKQMSRIQLELESGFQGLKNYLRPVHLDHQWGSQRNKSRQNLFNYRTMSTLPSHASSDCYLREEQSLSQYKQLRHNYQSLKQYLRYVQQLFTDRSQ